MVVTIQVPPPSTHVGPGFPVHIQSSFVGPLPTGSGWNIFVRSSPETNNFVYEDNFSTNLAFWDTLIALPQEPAKGVPTEILAEGQTAYVQAILHDDRQVPLDSITVPLIWTPTQMAWQQTRSIQASSAVQGGFTETDRITMEGIGEAVQTALAVQSAAGQLIDIGRQIFRFPFEMLARGAGGSLTGRGTLNPPRLPTGETFAYGMLLNATIVPPGFSVRDGFVQSYPERVGQLVTLHQSAHITQNMVSDVFVLDVSTRTWRWSDDQPVLIGYDITPGCTVDYFWLTGQSP